ncbi:MAG: hypothetical protein HOO06_16380 [Bdellovibrionaceae bacterium]|nr:hypothetical protein [Pseudobdellovibrionaceae bacterium]
MQRQYELKKSRRSIPGSFYFCVFTLVSFFINSCLEQVNVPLWWDITLGISASEVAAGIGTGGDKIFRVSSEIADQEKLEKGILKPVLVGREFNSYKIPKNTGNFIIYANKAIEKAKFPNVMSYLLPHKNKLSQKREAKKGTIPWWNLHWPRKPKLFEGKKIIVRQTSSTLIAAVDSSSYYCLNSVIIIHPHSWLDEYLLVAILNSTLMNWYYQEITQEQGRVFAEVKPINLRKLPVPDEVQITKNLKTVKEIIQLTKLVHKNYDKKIITKIDNLVYKIYGLKKEEKMYLARESLKVAS